ncbi:MAG: elongation factor G [Myxococcota bacterium]
MPSQRVIRTVALVGADGAGKTALTAALLRLADAAHHPDGSTRHLDNEPEEQKRNFSLNIHPTTLLHDERQLHVLDCPGFPNFMAEVAWALRVCDGALLAMGAAQGARLHAEHFYDVLVESGRPVLGVVSRLDHERAAFESVVEDIGTALKVRPVPLHLPVGHGPMLRGLVDLLTMKAHLTEGFGTWRVAEIPPSLRAEAERWRTVLVEAAAESDDTLLGRYLERGTLEDAEIHAGLRRAMARNLILPLACEAAATGVGVRELLDLMVDLLPGPETMRVRGLNGRGEEETRAPEANAPLAAQVFRTSIDHFTGRMNHLRVFSGTLRADSTVLNPRTRAEERVVHLYQTDGTRLVEITEAGPGEVVVVSKLRDVRTGDTLCARDAPLALPPLPMPGRTVAYALQMEKDDRQSMALHRLLEEDPALELTRDAETGETLLWGMGQAHIDVTVERARRKFNVDLRLSPPSPAYHETITATAKGHGRYKRQTGGHGQYGDAHIELSPLPRGRNFEFEDAIVGGVIPRNFIPAVEKGIREAMVTGPLAGYPVVDVAAKLYFGSYHTVDSSDLAFQIAGSLAFKEAVKEARPILLEPFMQLEVVVPEEMVGNVMGDLTSRRAKVQGMEPRPRGVSIRAVCPYAELLDYDADLRSMTQGVGYFSMAHSHHEPVPPQLAQKIIERRRAEGKIRAAQG